ncbi:MAG: c-type cytochrome [Elusimicrobia bacterium]|nr:c-type cytochrome [Elusimicrobiota bacterium]
MKGLPARAAALILALGVGGLLAASSGLMPIKASSGHWAPTEWFLRFSMRRSIFTHSLLIKAPAGLDDPALALKGARHFESACRSCHGAPGLPPSPVARGMLPPPPELKARVEGRRPRELFSVVKHGIKLTGMPAWPVPGRDDEVWAMVAFLRLLPELDEAGYRRLARPGASPPPFPAPAAQACARCHGADGSDLGSGAFPRLAGQPAEYLRGALEAYRDGRRHSGIMESAAAGLSAEAVRELAEYFSGLPVVPGVPPKERDAQAIERGGRIARRGIPARKVPVCAACHGLETKRSKDAYPALAGQPAAYLVLQLELFKEGRRGGSAHAHLMEPVAEKLTPGEMRDAALFYESLYLRKPDPPDPQGIDTTEGRL